MLLQCFLSGCLESIDIEVKETTATKQKYDFFKPHYYSVNKINHIFDPRRIASNEMAVTAEPQ